MMLLTRRYPLAAALCVAIACFLPHRAHADPAADTPLKVVASFSILADMARHVGGSAVRVTSLIGPDGDTHMYEPRPADVVAIAEADVVLVNGLQLEGFLPRLVAASRTTAPVVELTRGIQALPANRGHDTAHRGDRPDPHAWQSVRNAQTYVRNIAAAFCAADPGRCTTYERQAAAYQHDLAALDDEIRALFTDVPAEKRVVITSHDAFHYFQQAYGIRFLAVEGLSTEAEASAADLAALIRQARQGHATALFTENMANPRLVEQIARETGMVLGGTLYADALSAADGPAATYIDMMRSNARALKRAMTSDQPPAKKR